MTPAAVAHSIAAMSPATYLALVVAVSVACQWFAWWVRIPSILLLLMAGFGIGQLVNGEEVFGHEIFFDGVRIIVGIILFEGSMSLRFRQLKDLGKSVIRLCTRTVLLAWVLISVTARLLGYDWRIALLLGAILVVTGPTVINPILRQLRPTQRVSSLLRWEGIVVDPIGTVLALLVFQAVVTPGAASTAVVTALLKTIVVAFGIGIGWGATLEWLLRRHAVPDFLQGVVLLAAAIGGFVLSDEVQAQSGLLTVTVLGIYLGNRPRLHLDHVSEFTEHLQVLFVGALFIMLGGRVTPDDLVAVAPKASVFLLVLIVVVRPLSVFGGLAGTPVTRNERVFLAMMAPRGVVAASVTSLFALGLESAATRMAGRADTLTGEQATAARDHAEMLASLSEQTHQMIPLVGLVIVVTVAVYGLGTIRLAERLGIASPNPQGVLFVGVNRWVVESARLLDELGIKTLVVARNYASLASARRVGLNTVTANILSEFAVNDLDLSGLGYFVACTPEDEVNATAAREFARVFGRANTFQLHREADSTRTGSDRRDVAPRLSARYAFAPPLSSADLDARWNTGLRAKKTTLTPKFTLVDFTARYGPDVVLLFLQRRPGAIEVINSGTKLPTDSGTLIALVPEPDDGVQTAL